MYSNDLNSAYMVEGERRNDERRAALESQLAQGLGSKHKLGLGSSLTIFGVLALIVVVIRAF